MQTYNTLDTTHKNFESWLVFHWKNPHVYDEIVRLAREAKAKGYTKWSIQGVFEIMRWTRSFHTHHPSWGYKLSHGHRSFYSRFVMENEPDLAGFFNLLDKRTPCTTDDPSDCEISDHLDGCTG